MFILFAIFVCICCRTDSEFRILFDYFKREYGREYNGDIDESIRFAIFKENMIDVDKKNALYYPTTEYGITQFSDLTQEEFVSQYLGFVPFEFEGKAHEVYVDEDFVSDESNDID